VYLNVARRATWSVATSLRRELRTRGCDHPTGGRRVPTATARIPRPTRRVAARLRCLLFAKRGEASELWFLGRPVFHRRRRGGCPMAAL